MIGGSSVESVVTDVLLEVQVSPVIDCPLELTASIDWVPPTTIFIRLGTNATGDVPEPEVGGTVKLTPLLDRPFCWI
jgi:hypothetical protein